jgi:hypothetical protein
MPFRIARFGKNGSNASVIAVLIRAQSAICVVKDCGRNRDAGNHAFPSANAG